MARGRGGAPPPDETPRARARALALRWLAARGRSEAQIRDRLAAAGLGGEAEEVVAWLRELRYLDDRALAAARARALLGSGRVGPRAVERRLQLAGIPAPAAREAAAAALRDAAPGGELALCRALAERRAGRRDLGALDRRARARLGRFLAGRGFSAEAVGRVLGGAGDPDPWDPDPGAPAEGGG